MRVMSEVVRGSLAIRQLDRNYAERISLLHRRALPQDVLPALGHGVLVRYYQYVLGSDSQMVLGAILDDELIGYCQLSFSSISLADVIKSAPWILMKIFWLGMTRPVLFIRGLLAMLTHPKVMMNVPEISFIALQLEFQGRGIGKELIREAGHIAGSRGCVCLTTKTANEVVRSMYERSFSARVVSTSSFLGRRYWYLSWPVSRLDDGGI